MGQMVRISIKWEPPMKLLQVATGVATVSKQLQKPEGIIFEDLFSCKVKVENGSHSYSSLEPEAGIPSALFNSVKNSLEIMLKSYHNGMTLSDSSFCWVEDESYFVVTTLYSNKKRIPRTRNVAIMKDEFEAINVVVGNYGDIHEESYDYALIEHLAPGIYPNVLKEMWFKWDKKTNKYTGCTKPKEFAHVVNFTIG